MQERSWSCRSRTWWFLCSPPQVYKVYNVLLDVTLFQRLSHFLIQLQCPHAWPQTQRKQKPNNELKDAAQLLWHSFMTFHHEQLKKNKKTSASDIDLSMNVTSSLVTHCWESWFKWVHMEFLRKLMRSIDWLSKACVGKHADHMTRTEVSLC